MHRNMAVPVIRATILISSESEDEPEIIAVSPQTRNAIVSRTAFAPPSSSLSNINSASSPTKKLRSDYIDNIVETITTKLPKSAWNKKKKRK
uniref:Uncharacterized protein n=1 Tax=Ciona savignyi TaxID=51511 RepID=H2YJ32_CIOSA